MTALLETHGPKREDWIKWWSGLDETSTNARPAPATRFASQDIDKHRRQTGLASRLRALERRYGRSPGFMRSSRFAPVIRCSRRTARPGC